MHTSQFESVLVHHNGGYDGDFIISDYPIKGDDCKSIKISGTKFFKIAKDIIKKKKINYRNNLDITIHGKNEDFGNKPDSIQMNSKDIVELYLQKLYDDEIEKLEQMDFKQLLKRYTK